MTPRGALSNSQSKDYAQKYAQEKLQELGYDKTEWSSLKTLWNNESKWNHKAQNPTSSAYGIPQILNMPPGTPIEKQIDLGMKYIQKRYKTPSLALEHQTKKGWY